MSTCTLFTELSASQGPLENFLTAWRDFVERRSELVVEVETLYGTVVHKLVETMERTGGRRMWIVVPNPQAVIYLPLLLRTRREPRRKYDVEFYTLDVTSRGLVRLTDVATMLVKKWKETTEGAEEA